MLRNSKVLLGQTISAGIKMDKAFCLRALADGFYDHYHNKPSGNIMAFGDHS